LSLKVFSNTFGVTILKIGEFSKTEQISIKTLRYYDRMGLLRPAPSSKKSGAVLYEDL
jgi:DNA-binding transcriptional MerR regulator